MYESQLVPSRLTLPLSTVYHWWFIRFGFFNSFVLLLLHCKLFLFCQKVDTRWTASRAVCRWMDDWHSLLAHQKHVESEGERRERELFIVDEVKIMKRKGFSNWVCRRRRKWKKCFFQCRSVRIKRKRTHYILTFIVDWLRVIDRDDGNFEEARSFRTIP